MARARRGTAQRRPNAKIDKSKKLSPELEREVAELASIIIDFYREWKQR